MTSTSRRSPPRSAAASERMDRGSGSRFVASIARLRARPVETLARRRVSLGFIAAVVALIFADPTWRSWCIGLVVALGGEALRAWAAGHLEKGREVTRSGPYRWTRHPLYVGSSLIALGVVIAARHPLVTI